MPDLWILITGNHPNAVAKNIMEGVLELRLTVLTVYAIHENRNELARGGEVKKCPILSEFFLDMSFRNLFRFGTASNPNLSARSTRFTNFSSVSVALRRISNKRC